MPTVMQGPLYFDNPTDYRIRVNDRPRVVYERRDYNDNFVRFVVYRTPAEIRAAERTYLPAKVGIQCTYEVMPHEIGLEKTREELRANSCE